MSKAGWRKLTGESPETSPAGGVAAEELQMGAGAAGGSRIWEYVWRIIHLILGVFFALATFVQLNDSDPYIWIPIYLVPCILALAIVINKDATEHVVWRWTAVIHLVLCVGAAVYAGVMLGMASGKEDNWQQGMAEQEELELAGLMIVALYLGVFRFSPLSKCSGSWSAKAAGRSVGLTSPHKYLLMTAAMLALAPLFFWSLCLVEGWDVRLRHCRDHLLPVRGKQPEL